MIQKDTQNSQSESPGSSSNISEPSAPTIQTTRAQARDPPNPASLGRTLRERSSTEPSNLPSGGVGAVPYAPQTLSGHNNVFCTDELSANLQAVAGPQNSSFGSQSRLGQATPTYSTIERFSTDQPLLYIARNLEQRPVADPKPFKCTATSCSAEFEMFKLLRTHRQKVHGLDLGLQEFVCQFCDHDPFTHRGGWSKHMCNNHPQEPINDEICDYPGCQRRTDPIHRHRPDTDTGEKCEHHDCNRPKYPIHRHRRHA